MHQAGQPIRSETGSIAFRCDLCHHVEEKEAEMRAHFALHDNKLKCVICSYMCKSAACLIRHMRVHVNEQQIYAENIHS